MKNQNFGIEIEMTGITRSTAAKVIAGYFHTEAIIFARKPERNAVIKQSLAKRKSRTE